MGCVVSTYLGNTLYIIKLLYENVSRRTRLQYPTATQSYSNWHAAKCKARASETRRPGRRVKVHRGHVSSHPGRSVGPKKQKQLCLCLIISETNHQGSLSLSLYLNSNLSTWFQARRSLFFFLPLEHNTFCFPLSSVLATQLPLSQKLPSTGRNTYIQYIQTRTRHLGSCPSVHPCISPSADSICPSHPSSLVLPPSLHLFKCQKPRQPTDCPTWKHSQL